MSPDQFSQLAKQAAAVAHSNSKRVKLNKPGGPQKVRDHMATKPGNGQSPHRYGRRFRP